MEPAVFEPQRSESISEQPAPGMKALTISVSLPQNTVLSEQSARELLVLALVESGRLSQSQGTRALGIGRYDLIELMERYGLPVVSLNPQELDQERESLSRLHALRQREEQNPSAPPEAPSLKQRSR